MDLNNNEWDLLCESLIRNKTWNEESLKTSISLLEHSMEALLALNGYKEQKDMSDFAKKEILENTELYHEELTKNYIDRLKKVNEQQSKAKSLDEIIEKAWRWRRL